MDIMDFAGKWIELENIMLSEVTQTKKDMHVCTTHLIVDIRHKVQNTPDTPHRPKEVEPEGRLKRRCLNIS